jgi:MFS family permease
LPTTSPDRPQSLPRGALAAASAGTVFEWYDFYLFALLAPELARAFFGSFSPVMGISLALWVVAAGFIARPFGALLFGSVGDKLGRRTSFLVTIVVMGLSTVGVALLPAGEAWGLAAPLCLLLLRLCQGLALGGEYGGALTYVAECAPARKRGAATAWLQLTASLGLLLALMVVLGTRHWLGDAAFAEWGWRVPFGLAGLLLMVSVWVRLKVNESPAFTALRQQGRISAAPVRELFGSRQTRRLLALAVFGLCAGQAVVWYAAQYYTLIFMQVVLGFDSVAAMLLMGAAIALVLPLFVLFGALSDRIGRKPLILGGFLLSALTLVPLFDLLARTARPDLHAVSLARPVILHADPAECSVLPMLRPRPPQERPCDAVRAALVARGVPFQRQDAAPGLPLRLEVAGSTAAVELSARAAMGPALDSALRGAGYPANPPPPVPAGAPRWWALVGLLILLGAQAAMVYGPLAAALAEIFPTRLRYSATGLAYHLGNGLFGGLLPAVAFSLVLHQGSQYAGLAYPVLFALLCFFVAWRWLPETKGRDVRA